MKWIEENPVGTLKPPKFHQKPTLPFTKEEFEQIRAAVEKYPTKNSFGYDNRARLAGVRSPSSILRPSHP